MLFGGLMMILFWGGLIALAVVIIRSIGGLASKDGGQNSQSRMSPLEILEERYARGEIDKADFLAFRTDLSG